MYFGLISIFNLSRSFDGFEIFILIYYVMWNIDNSI